jgi:hypothetical protein
MIAGALLAGVAPAFGNLIALSLDSKLFIIDGLLVALLACAVYIV